MAKKQKAKGKEKEKKPLFNFKKNKEQEEPLASPEEEISDVPKRFQRRRRILEVQEEAAVEEVAKADGSSIFKRQVVDREEHDLLAKKKSDNGKGVTDYSEHQGEEEIVLQLSKDIADAFGLETMLGNGESLFTVKEEHGKGEEGNSDFSLWSASTVRKPREDKKITVDLTKPNVEGKLPVESETAGKDVLACLKGTAETYGKLSGSSDYADIIRRDGVPEVAERGNLFVFANYKVFVDGIERSWDKSFEIKVPCGSIVELDTGVEIKVPENVSVVVAGVPELEAKYALKLLDSSVANSITARFVAKQGAYLSKIGRVLECSLIA